MAQQTTVTLTDDLDGGKAAETVSFGLDGAHYEIDLSAKNAKTLRKAFAEFAEAGRHIKVSALVAGAARPARKNATANSPVRTDKGELAAIRAWAAENSIEVAARGRISEAVKAQYAAATR